jgi:hypothetical protein
VFYNHDYHLPHIKIMWLLLAPLFHSSHISELFPSKISSIPECLHGWEYDKTYYTETIITQENWVCDKNMYATNLLGFGKIGEILGTLLSQLGDV